MKKPASCPEDRVVHMRLNDNQVRTYRRRDRRNQFEQCGVAPAFQLLRGTWVDLFQLGHIPLPIKAVKEHNLLNG